MTNPTPPEQPTDFSLVLGGPLFQMCRRTHLSGPALELLNRRMLTITLIAWVPLVALSAVDGHLFGGSTLTFLGDIESHVRLLVALPALIWAELVVHHRIGPVVKRFVERRVVRPEDTPAFHSAVTAATRARNSPWLEMALLLFVYTVGHWVWQHEVALGASTWYAVPEGTDVHLTRAGLWYGFISIPIFQFILFRWYLRLVIWFWLLWRISRLNLHLVPTHPDRAGGIGFVGGNSYAFGPILFAQGALTAGVIASRIFYQGQTLLSFKMMIAGMVSFFVLVIVGPLAMFTPQLFRAKRNGLADYGLLATIYVDDFDGKWIRGAAQGEALLGSADIQSLADLGNSFAVVREMRLVPFALRDVLQLVAAVVLPLLPLLLTSMPIDELLTRLLTIMF